jgi:FAD/FMN-containing dehydrogenase
MAGTTQSRSERDGGQAARARRPTHFARDVSTAVHFARDHALLLSVKGGGHNIAGTAIAEDALTLDMSSMRSVDVDPEARLAMVGPGCLLQDVDRATQEHGLATVLGFVSETGVAGLTLGGGFGYLTRRFGWAVDNLEEAEIVTADGQLRVANREVEPELFWAVRGGGGNFGVVTRFTFRLHEVGPTSRAVWRGRRPHRGGPRHLSRADERHRASSPQRWS